MAGLHAQKSPSGAKRLHNCAGSIPFAALLRAKGLPTSDGPQDAADKGTAAHHLLEICLSTDEIPEHFRGRMIAVDDSGAWMLPEKVTIWKQKCYEVDTSMIEGVGICVEYVRARLAILGLSIRSVTLEQRTNPLPERDDTSGTADISIDGWPVVLEVVDYKNGRWYVEHEDNPQVLAYLLGRAHDTGWEHSVYRITICQPNAEGGFEPRSQEFTAPQLRVFESQHREACLRVDQATAALEEAKDDEALAAWTRLWLRAGDHCTFCPAMAVCPERKKYAYRQVAIDFQNMPVPFVDTVTLQRAVEVAKHAKELREYITACEDMVRRALDQGTELEGVTTTPPRGKRAWRSDLSPEVIIEAMVNAGYINKADTHLLFETPKMITGPQAEKLVPPAKRKDFSSAFLRKRTGTPLLTFKGESNGDQETSAEDGSGA